MNWRKILKWIVALVGTVTLLYGLMIGKVVYDMHKVYKQQSDAAELFFGGLSENELNDWVVWANMQMETASENNGRKGMWYGVDTENVPDRLKGLRLMSYSVSSDVVYLKWVGGIFGNISLVFTKREDSEMKVVRWFNEEKSEIIWPKSPGQP